MSIQQTRTGFNFQDYVAVYVFLKEYLDKQIQEFYVDYLYNEADQLSHDIYYITSQSDIEKIFCIEVKTGDRFCTERELIGKALCEIYTFMQANAGSNYAVFLSKELKATIGDCWVALHDLKDRSLVRISSDSRQKINLIKTLPHLKELSINDDDIRDYVSRLIIMNPSDDVVFSLSHDEGIELAIEGLIRKLGREILGVRLDTPRNPLIYPHNLTQDLIYVTAVNAGTNSDILPYYREAIAKFFSLAQQDVRPDTSTLERDQASFERELRIHEGLIEVPSQQSISGTSEIGVPS